MAADEPMYSIGARKWPGLSKIVEEGAELLTVIGKIQGIGGETNHWSGNLLDMLYDEMGDVMAALTYTITINGLDLERVEARMRKKLALYAKWHCGQHEPRPVSGEIDAK